MLLSRSASSRNVWCVCFVRNKNELQSITGGCTTLSRGRYGHPTENRTISVREAATLQTFPEDYIFDTQYMDKVCNIIGNALPCEFAQQIASQCLHAMQSAGRIPA